MEEARKNTNKLIEIIEQERPLTDLELGLLNWLSDDEVGEFAEANEYFIEDDDEDCCDGNYDCDTCPHSSTCSH